MVFWGIPNAVLGVFARSLFSPIFYFSILENVFNGKYPETAISYVAETARDTEMLTYLNNRPNAVYGVVEIADYLATAARTYNSKAQLDLVIRFLKFSSSCLSA